MTDIKLYSDGAARGNPNGPGGYGSILQFTDSKGKLHEKEYSCGYKKTTNNRMELMGVITGLEALTRPCRVEVYTDSKYITDAFNRHWVDAWQQHNWVNSQKKPVKNPDLWKRLLNAMNDHEVHYYWVKGHNGHPLNERCDRLATMAADGSELLDDSLFDGV